VADLTMHEHEQRAILENPAGVMLLMNWHDYQQTCAEAMDMDCQGNRRRYEELKAHGRAIVLKDPEIWSDEVLRAFDVPRLSADQQEQSRGGEG
jgi:hypothetical protein